MADLGARETLSKGVTKTGHSSQIELSPEHYLKIIWHRKWLIITVFVISAGITVGISHSLPNVYTSETVILVDPQKVPDSYVKATVTGDVRDRLGTLSQQILSATRLQKIIDTFGLYIEERKKLAREDVILLMRRHISVSIVSDFGGSSQDLQAFRIAYSGRDPRVVAQVTNELASLFIEENLRAREQQAEGTTEFLSNQVAETRKKLEEQEQQLRDFKLKHIGEMPEQQTADLQILGQLQTQLLAERDVLNNAEQQRTYLRSMLASQASAPVVDLDQTNPKAAAKDEKGPSTLSVLESKLAQLKTHYSDQYPDIVKLKQQIADEEAKNSAQQAETAASSNGPVEKPASRPVPAEHYNPVLQSQLDSVESQISKHKAEYDRIAGQISQYQAKVEAIPIREQQIHDLVRDYETSKTHYAQLLEKQLSAETATQLEIRQKGEKFSILDPAQPAERPSQPNRKLIDGAGLIGGLLLGLFSAIAGEFLGMSIATAEQVRALTGIPVVEVVPVIRTLSDRRRIRRRIVLTGISTTSAAILFCALYFFNSYKSFL